jgi:agmatinase
MSADCAGRRLAAGEVGLLGLPTDEASSFARGAARGPQATRDALYSDSSNLASEAGPDLGLIAGFVDLGDLPLGERAAQGMGAPSGLPPSGSEGDAGAVTRARIETAVAAQLDAGGRLVCLGGDHSVAYPILRAYGPRHPGLTVVQIDAHSDLYDSFEGSRYSHACPFARVMEEGLVKRLLQVGIRTANEHQQAQAARFGVDVVPRARWGDVASLALEPPVYLSLDLDGLDPAFAPGVAHLEAGGLTPREVLEYVWGAPGLVGADVVELNPGRDVGGITAALAAKLVKELVGRLLAPDGSSDSPG